MYTKLPSRIVKAHLCSKSDAHMDADGVHLDHASASVSISASLRTEHFSNRGGCVKYFNEELYHSQVKVQESVRLID